jgi:hypothetical protein
MTEKRGIMKMLQCMSHIQSKEPDLQSEGTKWHNLQITCIFRSKQIHRNNEIRSYKTLIKPVLCYGSVTWP